MGYIGLITSFFETNHSRRRVRRVEEKGEKEFGVLCYKSNSLYLIPQRENVGIYNYLVERGTCLSESLG
jgi:hypothetical protein